VGIPLATQGVRLESGANGRSFVVLTNALDVVLGL